MKNKNTKKKIISIISLVASITAFVVMIVSLSSLKEKNYKYCLENPPSISWIEEDLEPIFMTTGVCVLDEDNEGKDIYYKVNANNFYYTVRYSIAKDSVISFKWKYKNYIQINWIED